MCIASGWSIGPEPARPVRSAYLQGQELKSGAHTMINNERNSSFHVMHDYNQSQGEQLTQSKSQGTFSTSVQACFIHRPRCSNQLRSDGRAAIRVRARVRGKDIVYRFLRGSRTGRTRAPRSGVDESAARPSFQSKTEGSGVEPVPLPIMMNWGAAGSSRWPAATELWVLDVKNIDYTRGKHVTRYH